MECTILFFLKKLEEKIPPPENCHHALTFAYQGNATDGWRDRLALQINHEGTFYCFFLDEGDIEDWWRVAAFVKDSLAKSLADMKNLRSRPD